MFIRLIIAYLLRFAQNEISCTCYMMKVKVKKLLVFFSGLRYDKDRYQPKLQKGGILI